MKYLFAVLVILLLASCSTSRYVPSLNGDNSCYVVNTHGKIINKFYPKG